MRTVTTYDRLSSQAERKVMCPGCGRKRTIRRTFHQTVNPWNRNDDGTTKTHLEVVEAVTAEAAAWKPAGRELYHAACLEIAQSRTAVRAVKIIKWYTMPTNGRQFAHVELSNGHRVDVVTRLDRGSLPLYEGAAEIKARAEQQWRERQRQ